MHIPDGFLDPKFSGGLLGAALSVLGFCAAKVMSAVTALVPERVLAAAGNSIGNIRTASRRMLTEIGEKKLAQSAQVAALIFAAQTLNFPVNSGTSGHLIGGVFASVLLGPFAGTLVLAVVLIVQAFLFADGGVHALGANIVNMAILGSFVSYYIYAGIKRVIGENLSILFTAWLSVVLAASACALEIGLAKSIPLSDILPNMFKIHTLIGIFEAFITIGLLKVFRKIENNS